MLLPWFFVVTKALHINIILMKEWEKNQAVKLCMVLFHPSPKVLSVTWNKEAGKHFSHCFCSDINEPLQIPVQQWHFSKLGFAAIRPVWLLSRVMSCTTQHSQEHLCFVFMETPLQICYSVNFDLTEAAGFLHIHQFSLALAHQSSWAFVRLLWALHTSSFKEQLTIRSGSWCLVRSVYFGPISHCVNGKNLTLQTIKQSNFQPAGWK